MYNAAGAAPNLVRPRVLAGQACLPASSHLRSTNPADEAALEEVMRTPGSTSTACTAIMVAPKVVIAKTPLETDTERLLQQARVQGMRDNFRGIVAPSVVVHVKTLVLALPLRREEVVLESLSD